MQSNIPGDDLGIGFLGTVRMNGVPAHVQSGYWPGLATPGLISPDNTQTAYFGRVVSMDPSPLADKLFLIGWKKGLVVVGPLLNRQGIRENEPAKPDYILGGQPAEAVQKGPVWIGDWNTTTGKQIPQRGDMVVFRETTGEIAFLDDGSAVPAGWKPLLAAVVMVDFTTNGVEVDFESQDYSILPTEDET